MFILFHLVSKTFCTLWCPICLCWQLNASVRYRLYTQKNDRMSHIAFWNFYLGYLKNIQEKTCVMVDSFAPGRSGYTWWLHEMESLFALLALCAGSSPVTGEFPSQRPVTRSFDVFFDLRLNKRLSKIWWGWWFETPWCSLWRNCNYTKMQLLVLFDWLVSWDFLKWMPRDLTDNKSVLI